MLVYMSPNECLALAWQNGHEAYNWNELECILVKYWMSPQEMSEHRMKPAVEQKNILALVFLLISEKGVHA